MMKALVIEDVQKAVIQEVPVPVIEKDGLIIKTMANGVCRSDWHVWVGDHGIVQPVIGHEFCGIVEEVGSEIKNFKRGDRVIVPFSGSDGTCPHCIAGNTQLCDSFIVPGTAYQGGYGEYVAVPKGDRNAISLPDNLSFSDAAALGCRFMTAYHGVVDRVNVMPGEKVVVYGCGGIGLSAIHIASSMGAFVIGVDINDSNLALAKKLGADFVINSKDNDPVEAVQEITKGGADVSVDALGITETCVPAIHSLKKGGRHLQIGVTSKKEAGFISIPVDHMVLTEKSFITTLGIPAFRFTSLLEQVALGKLQPGKMVTREIGLSEVEGIFEDMSNFATTGTFVVTDYHA
ncbi:zinc-binding dehydrogenase [Planococcus shenhongbingii]|uniref:Zinc-binding dehydrogenase n=2 Tax=Planococcus shenhongbingii TaxID=3058398 RepID=A0ABT8NEU0_9BACL|nr:zinc-binding dehydrogenase [Planococcus sp. N016]MDN7246418.1 zinc-binding dehydrogenase [Planococcus sp. N017]WKA59410.1 zinc-binding dehydrogenase [Planococcus sp. N016]